MPETIPQFYFIHIMGAVLIAYSLVLFFYYSKTTPGSINTFGGYGCFSERFRASQEKWETSQKIAGCWTFGFGVIELVLGFISNAFPATFNDYFLQCACYLLPLPLSIIGIEIHLRRKFPEDDQND